MQHSLKHVFGSSVPSLLVALLLIAPFGCRTISKVVDGATVKVVGDKVAPVAGGPGAGASMYFLIAEDGTICQVARERYYATSIGTEARCTWRASRAEAARELAQP